MQQLLDNIHNMANYELVGLAKNRFLPSDLELAIAKTGYRVAQTYLAEKPELSRETREYLWSDECNRGYSLKWTMIASGVFAGEPSRYWDLFERYPNIWTRSPWRARSAFLHSYSWNGTGARFTPSELLDRIHDEQIHHTAAAASGLCRWTRSSILSALAKHPNCSLKTAIKISTCGDQTAEKHAFDKIVELS